LDFDDQLYKAIKSQTEQFMKQPHFDKKPKLMVEMAKKEGVSDYVDFGSHSGRLARKIFDFHPDLKSYTGIEAIPVYVKHSIEFVNECRFSVIPALLTDKLTEALKNNFTVDLADPFNSSSLYTSVFNKPCRLPARISTADAISVRGFVNGHPQLFADHVFVSSDIDGLDTSLVGEVLLNFKPKIIQFECWKFFYRQFSEIRKNLTARGYKLPEENFEIPFHMFSLACSSERWFYVGVNYSLEPSGKMIWGEPVFVKSVDFG
jgi:hypothetical protein